MKVYYNMIRDKYGNMNVLVTFGKLVLGETIGWGHDETEPNAIRLWTVLSIQEGYRL